MSEKDQVYYSGYAAGLADGEKRLARALRRWMNKNCFKYSGGGFMSSDACRLASWIDSNARAKRRRGR
jgi:hypothetical protein